jgi:hypothetical protein
MTGEHTFVSNSTAVVILIAVVALIGLLTYGAQDRAEKEERRGCMEALATPDPESIDYDNQALEFTSQVRNCMRG